MDQGVEAIHAEVANTDTTGIVSAIGRHDTQVSVRFDAIEETTTKQLADREQSALWRSLLPS
eukprot:6704776-Alexandrium_andersonii.AAC.1